MFALALILWVFGGLCVVAAFHYACPRDDK
jgi:hypothetical protein